MKNVLLKFWHVATLCLIIFLLPACQDIPTQAIEDPIEGETIVSSDQVGNEAWTNAAFSKRDCSIVPLPKGCKDSDDGDPPAGSEILVWADYVPGGSAFTNELSIPDNDSGYSGVRRGTAWSVGFGLDVDGTEVVDTGRRGSAPGCPNVRFGLIEVMMKKDTVTTVWLRGNDGDGTSLSSDRVAVESQLPGNGVWTLKVRKSIVMNTGKGQKSEAICTVYVHDIQYTPVTI